MIFSTCFREAPLTTAYIKCSVRPVVGVNLAKNICEVLDVEVIANDCAITPNLDPEAAHARFTKFAIAPNGLFQS